MTERTLSIGDHVVFVDSRGVKHNALVTHVWGQGTASQGGSQPGCNLVYVDSEESKTDPYGRQIGRSTSVVHVEAQPAKANCWAYPNEGI